MPQLMDLKDKVFGEWTVLCLDNTPRKTKSRHYKWICNCSCGMQKSVFGDNLRNGTSLSCGHNMGENLATRLKGKPAPNRLIPEDAIVNSVYYDYYSSSKDRNLVFELTKDDIRFFIKQICYYCGDPPRNNFGKSRPHLKNYKYNGIDRIDNDIGYIKNNCVSCCKDCNYMKRKLTEKDFLEHIEKIYNNKIKVKNNDSSQVANHFPNESSYFPASFPSSN